MTRVIGLWEESDGPAGDGCAAHQTTLADAHIVANGWEARFAADPVRGAEAAALYESLGFEVRLEPATPGVGSECDACRQACHGQVLLYTRRPGQSILDEGGLK